MQKIHGFCNGHERLVRWKTQFELSSCIFLVTFDPFFGKTTFLRTVWSGKTYLLHCYFDENKALHLARGIWEGQLKSGGQ